MKTKLVLLSLSGLLALAGCTFYVPVPAHMASTQVSPDVQVVGTVEGESRASYFLFFGPFGDSSLKAAIQDALSKRGGDAMINVSIDQSVTVNFFGWYRAYRTMIMGTSVKYPK